MLALETKKRKLTSKHTCIHACMHAGIRRNKMNNYKINQTYRIDIETVEKLQDKKAIEGTSINELVNTILKLGLEVAAEVIYIDNDIEADIEVPSIPNPNIKAPKFDTVTEGYNPNDKKMPSAASYMKDLKF